MSKSPAKTAFQKRRNKAQKAAPKIARPAEKKVAPERAYHAQLKTGLPLQPFPYTTVHDAFRGIAERNVAQTRELYEQSKGTIQAILESWQKTFGAAAQGAVALNRRIFDTADRNMNNTLDWAAELAEAKNLTEVMEVQTAFWRKQLTAGQ
jgi:hypothetical protein